MNNIMQEDLRRELRYVLTYMCDNPVPSLLDEIEDTSQRLRAMGWHHLPLLSKLGRNELTKAVIDVASDIDPSY